MWKTQGLKQALDHHGFDVALGGARRDEEKSRAKERIFSVRSAQHQWDAKQQRPELWHLYNVRMNPSQSIRVFPLSNWTELDVWQYIRLQQIPVVSLYLAAERPVIERDGMLLMVDDDRMPLEADEIPTNEEGPFSYSWLLSPYGSRRVKRGHVERSHSGDAPDDHVRTTRPSDRPRPERIDGEEEAGGILLMSTSSDLISNGHRGLSAGLRTEGASSGSSPAEAWTTGRAPSSVACSLNRT